MMHYAEPARLIVRFEVPYKTAWSHALGSPWVTHLLYVFSGWPECSHDCPDFLRLLWCYFTYRLPKHLIPCTSVTGLLSSEQPDYLPTEDTRTAHYAGDLRGSTLQT
jgi:hypothetical protein